MTDESKLLVLSHGIRRIPNLHAFFPEFGQLVKSPGDGFDAVAGWGVGQTSAVARGKADKSSVPYLALEDGFLRSICLGRDGEPPLSLVVDPVGIYYDARRPSQLENLLEKNGWESTELLERARFALKWLIDERLSKYNASPEKPFEDDRQRVLVVDQTFGDMSVVFGQADETSFRDMLQAAIDENPSAEILVRRHPETHAGHRPGYLNDLPDCPRLRSLEADIHPWSILDGVTKVYTVSSQLGLEALFAGKQVRCFGLPFYAGWGLTGDEVRCERRQQRRSLEELFAAAYIKYARYVDPISGEPCEIERIIALLADRRRHWLQSCRPVVFCNASWWRRSFLAAFVTRPGVPVKYVRHFGDALQVAKAHKSRLAIWASTETPEMRDSADRLAVPLVRVEDAFLRSVGLGSDLCRPWSIVIDDLGIYYNPAMPSRLEKILSEASFSDGLLERAEYLRRQLMVHRLTKYNVGEPSRTFTVDTDRDVILVVGQVEDDASLQLGSPQIRSNLAFIEVVRSAAPDAFLVYKPHPDVVAGNRRGRVSRHDTDRLCDRVIEDVALDVLFEHVDQVHTMTSLTGFEALLRGKQVVTYGLPFYAGWGLTSDRMSCARRKRNLSLNELIAGTLILYPIYVYPDSRQTCSVEDLLTWLREKRTKVDRPDRLTRLVRFYRRLFPAEKKN